MLSNTQPGARHMVMGSQIGSIQLVGYQVKGVAFWNVENRIGVYGKHIERDETNVLAWVMYGRLLDCPVVRP